MASRDDVLRIVHRDFPEWSLQQVLECLDQYDGAAWDVGTVWDIERERAQLSALKLSRGDVLELQKYIDLANQDFRNVLGPAESPHQSSNVLSSDFPDPIKDPERFERELKQYIELDTRQYQAWLNSEEPYGGPQDPAIEQLVARFFSGPEKKNYIGKSGWHAPFVGAVIGMLVSLPGVFDRRPGVSPLTGIIIGVSVGFAGGLVMWSVDQRKSRRAG